MELRITNRLKGAYRGFTYSLLFSSTGLILELLVLALWSSIILLTDIIHWVVDTFLEAFALVSIYYAYRIGKRFPWGVLVIEGVVMLLSITIALSIYFVTFLGYIATNYQARSVTTTSAYAAIGTLIGMLFTLIAFLVQKRNYEKYRLEVIKVDYRHALIDIVASTTSTIGILAVYYTRSPDLEVLFVFIAMMFVVHSLVEMLRDVFKTTTGANIDHELSMKIYKKLAECNPHIYVKDVKARKIGSFYTVEAKIGVNADEKLKLVHRIRKKIMKYIQEESDLIYHIDVKVYPMFQRKVKRRKY